MLLRIVSLIGLFIITLSALDKDEASMWAVLSPQTEQTGEKAD